MKTIFSKKMSVWRAALLMGFSQILWLHALSANDLLERRVSVHFQQTPLKTALDEVARQAGFAWSYHAGIIAAAQPVTLKAQNWTVRETLHALLGDGYEFKPNGNYLILKKRRRPPAELSGYITDPNTGRRLSGATVYDRRTLRAATTDSNGYYRLKKVDRRAEVVMAKIGYRDTIVQIRSNSPRFQKIDLALIPPAPAPPPTFRQNLQAATTKVERFFAVKIDRWHALNVPDSLRRHVQISLLPAVGTNRGLSGQVENDWSLNVLAGHTRAVRYLEVGGLGNFTRERVSGVQVAGLFNLLRGNNRGVQVAGLYNLTRDTLLGIQVAGLLNTASQGENSALQVAGLANTLRLGSARVQVAGVLNSADTLRGVQVAGIANRARHARGLQIGLFNSADTLEGLQIGLLNRSGRRWLPVVNW